MGSLPPDYKFYCYGGEPVHLNYCFDRDSRGHAEVTEFDINWQPRPDLSRGHYDAIPEKPLCFDEMVEIAKALSKPFPFVRVDFYVEHDRPIFGELTFTPSGGLDLDYTPQGQQVLGELIDLNHIDYAALEIQ